MSEVLGGKSPDDPELGKVLEDVIPRIEISEREGVKVDSTEKLWPSQKAALLSPDNENLYGGATDEEMTIIDEVQHFNGLRDSDAVVEGEPFEFECTERHKDEEGMWYIVKPLEEYDNLNFAGHTVFINGRERLCDRFEVSEDGTISILVRDNAGT